MLRTAICHAHLRHCCSPDKFREKHRFDLTKREKLSKCVFPDFFDKLWKIQTDTFFLHMLVFIDSSTRENTSLKSDKNSLKPAHFQGRNQIFFFSSKCCRNAIRITNFQQKLHGVFYVSVCFISVTLEIFIRHIFFTHSKRLKIFVWKGEQYLFFFKIHKH